MWMPSSHGTTRAAAAACSSTRRAKPRLVTVSDWDDSLAGCGEVLTGGHEHRRAAWPASRLTEPSRLQGYGVAVVTNATEGPKWTEPAND